MPKKVDLSIIILSYNTRNLLQKCLKSVFSSISGDYSFKVIVVDNASGDGSVEMVGREFPQVNIIRSPKNLGYAGGNNLGLKRVNGRYILFLNSDTEITSDAIQKILDFMEKNLNVGAVTPKTELFSGGMDPDCHRGFPTPWASICYFSGLERLFPKSKLFGQYHKFFEDLNKPHEIDAGFGTFMVVRREVVKKIGGWDEDYFFYGEDLDYFYRIKKAGWKIMFYPEAIVRHHKGASSGLRKESKPVSQATREIRIKTARASIRAMELFYKKFYQNKYPALLTRVVIFGIKIKGSLRLLHHYLYN